MIEQAGSWLAKYLRTDLRLLFGQNYPFILGKISVHQFSEPLLCGHRGRNEGSVQ